MRSFTAAALVGAQVAAAFSMSDYILAAGWTPAYAPSFGASQDATSTTSSEVPAGEEPCGLISRYFKETGGSTVNSEIAYACLRSVPLDVTGGLLQLDGIATMVDFQSTLAYLKDPPSGYLYPAVDVEAGLASIKENLQNNVYSNEYDFQMAIFSLISKAHDGHFDYLPDIVGVFSFYREDSLFSLSADGLSIPQVWLGGTVGKPTEFVNSDKVMVPIAKINDQDAETWLNEYATLNGNTQDPDASYNSLFPIIPTLETNGAGLFTASVYYQGPNTNITFVDGTTRQINHTAVTDSDFTGVKDGQTFFEKFCTVAGKKAAQQQESNDQARASKRDDPKETPFKPVKPGLSFPAPPSFPKPVIALKDQSVAGYFPEAQNSDLAVLSIPSFEPKDPTGVSFSDTVRTFLATAQAAGKQKLMIDLRGNGGGDVLLAYDTFVQLFPKLYPYGGTNFRATPLVHDIGAVVSAFYRNVTEENATPDDCNNDYTIPLFDYRVTVNEQGEPFTSWDDFFGPHEAHGDNFTSIDRYDLDNAYSTFCSPISNYRDLVHITPQVFSPEDVVLVQDGNCASTCAVFSEFMKTQAGVQTIVFGGRAQAGPMQGVGGVKGANVYAYDTLNTTIQEAVTQDASAEGTRADLLETYGALFPGMARAIDRAAMRPTTGLSAHVNVRNAIRRGDASVTPLQFVYEAADCRLFYTPNQIFDQELVWKAAYEARWAGAPCVVGSTGQPSAQSGYLGVGGPTNNTVASTATVAPWSAPTGAVPSGYPSPHSNGTGIWGSSSATVTATSSSWGVTWSPTASVAPTVIIPSSGGAVVGASIGLGVTALGGLAGFMLLL